MEHADNESQDAEARAKPAEVLDALEDKVLGVRPEDRRRRHDVTENSDTPAHQADLHLQDWASTESGSPGVSEPPS